MRHMSKRVNALLYFLDNHHSRLGKLDNETALDRIRKLIDVGCKVDVQLENDCMVSDDCFFVSSVLITVPIFIDLETTMAVALMHPDYISKFSDAKNVLMLEWI